MKKMNHTLEVKQSVSGTLDPVCGMTVNPETAAGSFEYQGKTYYFCSTHCVHRFREDPEKFLEQASAAPQPIGITRAAKPHHQPKACGSPPPQGIRKSFAMVGEVVRFAAWRSSR